MSQQYVTVREAARRLGVTYERARQLLTAGQLKGIRTGANTLRVDARDLERLIRERRPRGL